MFAVIIRFIEMMICSVVLSAAMRGLMAVQIVNNTAQGIGIAFFIGMIIFIAIQVPLLRRDYFEARNRVEYVTHNLIAYAIFAVLSMAARICLGNVFHTWTFGIYKFMMFANADMTWWQSAIYGHIVMLAIIFLAPIGSPAARAYRLAAELGEDEFGNPLPDMDFEDDVQDSAANDDAQNAFTDPFRNLPDEITMLNTDEEYVEDDTADEW